MADLDLSAVAEVLPDTSGDIYSGIAGVAVTAGMAVYLNASTSKIAPADANLSLAAAAAIGIALNGAAPGQTVRVQRSGDVTLGATAAPAVGTVYVVSSNAGGIAPAADLGSAWYATVLGVGMAGSKLRLHVFASGHVRA
jgi:hypothetical protein